MTIGHAVTLLSYTERMRTQFYVLDASSRVLYHASDEADAVDCLRYFNNARVYVYGGHSHKSYFLNA